MPQEKNSRQSGPEGQLRATFYARYSSSQQRRASIEDQFRNCREAAEENGWKVIEECVRADEERSGKFLIGRTGMKELLAMAKQKPRPFDIIVIDDTSRFGRNMGDVFRMLDILEHNGVRLYFVSDDLDSGNEWFRDAFAGKARADEQFSRTHGKRVRRGRIGRFDAGYNPGGRCYGYRNEKVFDPTKKGEHGEPGIKGMRQVIDPEEAAVVLRIFNHYDGGQSLLQIALALNNEYIQPPQSTRKNLKPSWSKHAVQTILANDRYRGKLVYGRTTEKIDPETGKRIRLDNDQGEWRRREDPSLRVISDELWDRVRERRKVRAEKLGVKRSGGMNRTEASRRYLLSGLLRCGVCDGPMSIRATKPARYSCSNHACRGSCSNRATIRQDSLESAFLSALADQLRSEEFTNDLVQMLLDQLRQLESKRLLGSQSAEEQRERLLASRSQQARFQQNLVNAVRESGGSRILYEDLIKIEASIAHIDEMLQDLDREPAPDIAPEDVRAYVHERFRNLESLLEGNREALRNHFQKRIRQIILTPDLDQRGPVYRVSGDIDLFSVPESVVQTQQVPLMGLHHTIPITFECRPYRNNPGWSKSTGLAASLACTVATPPIAVPVSKDWQAAAIHCGSEIYDGGNGGMSVAN